MKRAFLVFVFFALSCSSTQQPATTGSIAGTVTMDGFPVPGVTVTLSSKA